EASIAGGADACVLINEYKVAGDDKTKFPPFSVLEACVAAARAKFPSFPLGVNYLGDDADPAGWAGSFRLAREHGLRIVWTDFSGVDLIREIPRADLHAIKAAQPRDVFYCSGIHMKYSHLLDASKTIEESALEATGWVDGIVVT